MRRISVFQFPKIIGELILEYIAGRFAWKI